MCGITGILSNNKVNHILYEALFHIQHRGQDSHGFLTCDNKNIYSIKDKGLINNSIKNITILWHISVIMIKIPQKLKPSTQNWSQSQEKHLKMRFLS